jgi:hypothetical protein
MNIHVFLSFSLNHRTTTHFAVSTTYLNAVDKDVVPAVFRRVMCATISIDAPVALKRTRHTRRARTVRVAIEKGEIRRDEVLAIGKPQRQDCREEV